MASVPAGLAALEVRMEGGLVQSVMESLDWLEDRGVGVVRVGRALALYRLQLALVRGEGVEQEVPRLALLQDPAVLRAAAVLALRSGNNDAAAVTFLLEAASLEPERVARQKVLAGALEMMARQPERWENQVSALVIGERWEGEGLHLALTEAWKYWIRLGAVRGRVWGEAVVWLYNCQAGPGQQLGREQVVGGASRGLQAKVRGVLRLLEGNRVFHSFDLSNILGSV